MATREIGKGFGGDREEAFYGDPLTGGEED